MGNDSELNSGATSTVGESSEIDEQSVGSRLWAERYVSVRNRLIYTFKKPRAHKLAAAAALVIAVLSIPPIGPEDLGLLGLASALPAVFFLSLVVVLVGFVIALRFSPGVGVLGFYASCVAVLLHGLSPIVYQHMRYPWAWKHVGIVDFIQRTGSVDRHIESLSAYHNWPGFFGFNALATDLSGFSSSLSFSSWAPLFFNFAYLAVLYVIFRRFTTDERLISVGLVLFTIANWVGQDYFAPQAAAFLFYLLIIAVLLEWFDVGRREQGVGGSSSRQQLVMAGVLVVLIAAIVVTHQLTPMMMIMILGALTVMGGLRIKWPLLAAIGVTLLWLASFARPFVDDYLPRVIADLGNIGGRVDDGLIDYGQVDTSQRMVSLAARGLSGMVGLLAGLGFLRAFRGSSAWRTVVPLAAAPLLLVVASSYGDEIVFRAFLFALPMLALFGAALWFPSPTTKPGLISQLSLGVVLVGLSVASLVAMHGNDVHTTFTDDEVAAATAMYERAIEGSGVIQLTNSYPTKFRNYEALEELDVATFSDSAKERFLADPDLWFATWLQEDYTEGYVLLTRSQVAEVQRVGMLPEGAPQAIEAALRSSDSFVIVYDSDDAVLFMLDRQG